MQQQDGEMLETILRGLQAFGSCAQYARSLFEQDSDLLRFSVLQPMHGFGFLMGSSVEKEFRQWLRKAADNEKLGGEAAGCPILQPAAPVVPSSSTDEVAPSMVRGEQSAVFTPRKRCAADMEEKPSPAPGSAAKTSPSSGKRHRCKEPGDEFSPVLAQMKSGKGLLKALGVVDEICWVPCDSSNGFA